MATDWLVVMDALPVADVPKVAAAWVEALGGTQMDRARTLRSTTGIAKGRLTEEHARTLSSALTNAGAVAYAVNAAMVPRLPKPLTARKLDPRDDALYAQVALTGPPLKLEWNKIVLTLPAIRLETRTTGGGVKKTKVGIGTVAIAAATGFGAGKVISAIRGKGEAQAAVTNHLQHSLVEILALGPLRRIHGPATRLDYSVLGDVDPAGKRNFAALLQLLAERTNPSLASAGVLRRYIDTAEVPAMLRVDDSNGLAAVSRWLLLRGAMRRLAQRGG